jgi:hypothetical protein
MTQMLILVHGMGTNPPGWADSPGGPKAKLNEVAARYSAFKGKAPFTDRLTVKEIAYDHCFAEVINQWQNESSALGAWATASGQSLPKIVSWLGKTLPASEAAAKDFFWSTASDPLLYRGFRLIRDRVRVAVMKALVDILANGGEEALDVTIVAHSLGTAVMHDALHLLGTGVLPDEVKDVEVLMPDRWKFSNLFMIADMCRLGPPALQDIDYYESVVRPATPERLGYCRKFFEVWHRYDPFAVAAPFRPATWGSGYRPIGPLSHFRQANVHGFTHYLDHPAVHIPIVNFALAEEVIPAQEEADAKARYPDVVSLECDQQIARMKAKSSAFAGVNDDLEQLVIGIAEFYALAKDAGSKCKGIAQIPLGV